MAARVPEGMGGICRVAGAAAIAGIVWMSAASHPAAQAPTTDVDVEPLTCWWRTDIGAVRLGEPFAITLTCSLLDAHASRVILDESRLAPSVIQVPPFDVLGGARADDIGMPGRRFLQYRYDVRLIQENASGKDVEVPGVTLSYRVESRAPQGDPVQGRDLAYALPPLTVHVLSLVPTRATDIREAPVVSFRDIAATSFRATVLRVTAVIFFVIGTLLALIAVIRGLWTLRQAAPARPPGASPRAVLAAVQRELRDVDMQASATGWTPALVGRALSALRIAGAYAVRRLVTQQVSTGGVVDGQLRVRRRSGAPLLVSGSVTAVALTDVADEGLRGALATFTAARFGRDALAAAALDEGLAQGMAAAARLAARHAWWRESLRRLKAHARATRERVWAR